MKYITKKRILIFISVLLAVGAVYLAYVLYQDASVSSPAADSEKLEPSSAKSGDSERTISFAAKQKISFKKYGFRRELVVEKPTMLFQFVEDDLGMEHVRFGVYRDAALSSPVDEADIGYNLRAWWDFEEGGDLDDYPEYKPDLTTFLEPGTYYIGIYTTDATDTFTVEYHSLYSPVEEEIVLEEGKSAAFFGDGNEETFFRIDVPGVGAVTVDTHGFAGKLWLCDADKKEISDAVEVGAEWKRSDERKLRFDIKSEGSYYLKLTDYPKAFTEKNSVKGTLFVNHIKYSYQEDRSR